RLSKERFESLRSDSLKEGSHVFLFGEAFPQDRGALGLSECLRDRDGRPVAGDLVVLDPQARAEVERLEQLLRWLFIRLEAVVLLAKANRAVALLSLRLHTDAFESPFQALDLVLGLADVLFDPS